MSDEDFYPEHEKQKAVLADASLIGEFLEWLPTQGYHICSLQDTGRIRFDSTVEEYFPVSAGIEAILAQYFHINLNKIDKEKRLMLERLREKAL